MWFKLGEGARRILCSRPYVLIEFILLCLALPSYIIFNRMAMHMFTFLWAACAYALVILFVLYGRNIREIWKWKAVNWGNMKPMLIRWIISVVGMIGFLLWYDPDRFLYLLNENPQIIPMIMLFYPVFSALPQEIIFCSFFFKRYERWFGDRWLMIIMSAITFAYAHVLFINPVAPPLSFIGGLIFAHTYMKTKSLALVTIEHGLYGNALFVIGLGWYFYHGAVPG